MKWGTAWRLERRQARGGRSMLNGISDAAASREDTVRAVLGAYRDCGYRRLHRAGGGAVVRVADHPPYCHADIFRDGEGLMAYHVMTVPPDWVRRVKRVGLARCRATGWRLCLDFRADGVGLETGEVTGLATVVTQARGSHVRAETVRVAGRLPFFWRALKARDLKAFSLWHDPRIVHDVLVDRGQEVTAQLVTW